MLKFLAANIFESLRKVKRVIEHSW